MIFSLKIQNVNYKVSSKVTNDDLKTTSSAPIWWEMLVFRGLNFIMVLKKSEKDISFLFVKIDIRFVSF